MITTVIYDMDGLLLDTEPLWGESMLKITKRHGIPVSSARFKETTGLRIYEVTEYWATKYPWEGKTSLEVANEILEDIIALSKTKGSILPGVLQSLSLLKKENFKIGLASSSPTHMIHELTEFFGLKDSFECIASADDVDYCKPHPAVFLHCAKLLGSKPGECLVLEDSVNGVVAGKASRMKVVAVPDALHFDDPRFSLADKKLKSLEEFDLDLVKSLD
jgi:mannitol-1-/sugar-/sorbitol-6-/2-deoxyglucose-6-phosphatase